jgi:hypothetical protein
LYPIRPHDQEPHQLHHEDTHHLVEDVCAS